MKITLPYTYTEDVVPPRCRKPRPQEFTDKITLTLREVTGDEAPIAIIQHTHGYRDVAEILAADIPVNCKPGESAWVKFDVVYRWYKGKLYSRARFQRSCGEPHERQTAEQFTQDPYPYNLNRDTHSAYYARHYKKAGARCALMAWAREILFIDGERWHVADEPRYVIMTFGLGCNHGGSSLSVDTHYNSNIAKDRYYRIDQLPAAIEAFVHIALGRGDTESVPNAVHDTFEILIPEAIRCQPAKEAGPGDPFINKVEEIVSGVKDPLIAGLAMMGEAPR